MALSPTLLTLATQIAGEFENRAQAMAEPVWFVHLRLWQRPVPLFVEDSITLFAEQANVLKLDQPYRQRLLRLQEDAQGAIVVQYYGFKDPSLVRGGGDRPQLLNNATLEQIELLPGCILQVTQQGNRFVAAPPPNSQCYFSYAGETRQVSLGFETSSQEFFSYDKGVEPETGKALWGAMMGAYQFKKLQDYPLKLTDGV